MLRNCDRFLLSAPQELAAADYCSGSVDVKWSVAVSSTKVENELFDFIMVSFISY